MPDLAARAGSSAAADSRGATSSFHDVRPRNTRSTATNAPVSTASHGAKSSVTVSTWERICPKSAAAAATPQAKPDATFAGNSRLRTTASSTAHPSRARTM